VKELLATGNVVRLSFIRAVLDDAGIAYSVLDNQMASVLGSAFKTRLMVDEDDFNQAKRVMAAAEEGLDPD
jgi:hypothetical protein